MAKFTWPWEPTQRAIFWIKFFLETRLLCESLKPLISFLTFWSQNFIVMLFYFPEVKMNSELIRMPQLCQGIFAEHSKSPDNVLRSFEIWSHKNSFSRSRIWTPLI